MRVNLRPIFSSVVALLLEDDDFFFQKHFLVYLKAQWNCGESNEFGAYGISKKNKCFSRLNRTDERTKKWWIIFFSFNLVYMCGEENGNFPLPVNSTWNSLLTRESKNKILFHRAEIAFGTRLTIAVCSCCWESVCAMSTRVAPMLGTESVYAVTVVCMNVFHFWLACEIESSQVGARATETTISFQWQMESGVRALHGPMYRWLSSSALTTA